MAKRRLTSFQIDVEDYEELRRRAYEERKSMASIIRDALKRVLSPALDSRKQK